MRNRRNLAARLKTKEELCGGNGVCLFCYILQG